jgi:hemoglobin/transferrin/lactoferrin receptor protein
VTVFQNKVEDFIEGALVPFPPPFGTFQYTNVRNVTLEGVEFEAAYDARSWFLSMGAQRIRGTNDATGGPLNSVSPDQVSVTFGLRALDGKLTYGARARFVDKQERVATAAFLTSGYSVVDLFANWQATDNIALGLNVDNVADKQYIVFRDLSPSPGLAARLSVNVRLGAP